MAKKNKEHRVQRVDSIDENAAQQRQKFIQKEMDYMNELEHLRNEVKQLKQQKE